MNWAYTVPVLLGALVFLWFFVRKETPGDYSVSDPRDLPGGRADRGSHIVIALLVGVATTIILSVLVYAYRNYRLYLIVLIVVSLALSASVPFWRVKNKHPPALRI